MPAPRLTYRFLFCQVRCDMTKSSLLRSSIAFGAGAMLCAATATGARSGGVAALAETVRSPRSPQSTAVSTNGARELGRANRAVKTPPRTMRIKGRKVILYSMPLASEFAATAADDDSIWYTSGSSFLARVDAATGFAEVYPVQLPVQRRRYPVPESLAYDPIDKRTWFTTPLRTFGSINRAGNVVSRQNTRSAKGMASMGSQRC